VVLGVVVVREVVHGVVQIVFFIIGGDLSAVKNIINATNALLKKQHYKTL